MKTNRAKIDVDKEILTLRDKRKEILLKICGNSKNTLMSDCFTIPAKKNLRRK